jgi:hypothetical protein
VQHGQATVLYDDRAIVVGSTDGDTSAHADALWIHERDLPRINGFELKLHGACRGDICIPLAASCRRGALLDLTSFAKLTGQPVVCDADARVWSFGEMPALGSGLSSRVAPPVVVPDRAGRPVRLAGFRGKKILVVTWASW